MTSGKMHKKPDDNRREAIEKRTRKTLILAGKKIGRLTDSQKKTPSQLKSERGRARLNHRPSNGKAEPTPIAGEDCRKCPRQFGCKFESIHQCDCIVMTHRCKQCGQKWSYRYITADPWELCPKCRGEPCQ